MNHFFVFFAIFGAACAARLTGSITTTTSVTPAYTTVYAVDTVTGSSYQTRTAMSSFNLNLPDNGSYSVYALASGNFSVSGWTVDGYLPYTVGRITTGDGVTNADLTFEPAYTLILVSYVNGTARKAADFSPYIWTTDLYGVTSRFYRTTATSGATTTAALAVPLGVRVSIMSETYLPSAGGRIVLPADNSGLGFGSATPGGAVVQLNYETARTSLGAVKRKTERPDYSPSEHHVQAHASNADLLAGPFDTEQLRAAISDQVLVQSVATETSLELSRAEAATALYRTSNVTVRGTDEYGRTVSGLSITVQQNSQNFKFGVYGGQKTASGTDAWRQLADSGINAAVIDFWWAKTEPSNGTIEEQWILNQKIEYLASLGMSLRATGMFQPGPGVIPDYVKGLDVTQFGQALYNHVYTLVSRYCTGFELIEVSTDLNNLASLLGFNTDQLLALQKISLDAIQAAAPGVRTSVTLSSAYDPNASPVSAMQFQKQWAGLGQPIDSIGQGFYGGAEQPQYSVGAISDMLDGISASAGRPIRVSQLSAPSAADQVQQSQFLQQVYAVAYSKRLVREISWWEFIGNSALFAEDQTPTPAFWALRSFIQSRRTNLTLPVSSDSVSLRPYGGTHHVTVFKDGVAVARSDVFLDEGKQNKLAVVYKSDGTATVLLNQANGPVMGVVPAPRPYTGAPSGGDTSATLPQWSVYVIIFGTVGLVTLVALLAALTVLRRGRRTPRENISTPSEGAPVASVLPGKTYEIDLESGPGKTPLDVVPDSPSPWSGQPLTNPVLLDEIEDEEEESEESETDESSELEDVALDEQDISTDTTDTEEEHL